MNFKVRESIREDMPQVLELIKELAIFENEPDAVEVTVENLLEEGFSEPPLFKCFVAENDDLILGIALVYFRFSTWKGRSLHLEDLIVRAELRGSGIGKALYTRMIEYAESLGVKRIEWAVLDWNKGAIKFYEKSGAIVFDEWRIAQMDEVGINNYLKNK